jgi:predicted DNA-binding protein
MGWKKGSEKPTFLLIILPEFQETWDKVNKISKKTGETKATLVRKALKETYG